MDYCRYDFGRKLIEIKEEEKGKRKIIMYSILGKNVTEFYLKDNSKNRNKINIMTVNILITTI